jgi:hypothetical protein
VFGVRYFEFGVFLYCRWLRNTQYVREYKPKEYLFEGEQPIGHNSLKATLCYTYVSRFKIEALQSPLDKLEWQEAQLRFWVFAFSMDLRFLGF